MSVEDELWLSRVRLNARHPDAAGALRDAHAMHALTIRCLPPDARRAEANLLHHADLANGVVIVQSTVKPHWPETEAFRAQTKEITGFMADLGRGDRLRFTVRTVPMRRQSPRLRDGTAMRAPGEHALRTDRERIGWLEKRFGAAVNLLCPPSISVEPDRFGHRPTLFGGALEVDDADELRTLVVRGVGRAKAYGNGLLMLGR